MATTATSTDFQMIRCPICYEMYTNPRRLPCLHTFCESCLQKYIASSIEQNDQSTESTARPGFTCPFCREFTPAPESVDITMWAQNFPSDDLMLTLIERKKSTVISEDACSLCEQENASTAVTWCLDCKVLLCDGCEKIHRKIPVLKFHSVSNIDTRNEIDRIPEINCYCKEHNTKKLKLFCYDHDKPCCTMCALFEHRKCEKVVSLTDASTKLKSSLDSKLKSDLSDIKEEICKLLQNRKGNLSKFQDEKLECENSLTEFRKEINTFLDKLEEDSRKSIDAQYKQKSTDLEHHIFQLEIQEKAVENCSRILSALTDSPDAQHFLEIQILNRKLKGDVHFEFNVEKTATDILKLDRIAKIQVSSKFIPEVSLHELRKYKIREVNCFPVNDSSITGALYLENGKILLADGSRKTLLEYNEEGTKQRTLPLGGKPFDLCQLHNSAIVISLPDKSELQFVNIEEFKTIKLINFPPCYGVDCYQGHIYTLCKGEIRIIDSNGDLLKSIPINGDVKERYLCVADVGRLLYTAGNTLVSVSADGKEISKYTPTGVSTLYGVKVDCENNIYVIDYSKDRIHRLDDRLQVIDITDAKRSPVAISFKPCDWKFIMS